MFGSGNIEKQNWIDRLVPAFNLFYIILFFGNSILGTLKVYKPV